MTNRTVGRWRARALAVAALLVTVSCSDVGGQGNGGSEAMRAADAPEARVAALFGDFTQPGQPGCAVGVYRDGRVILATGYGLADIKKGVKIDADTVFNVGSVSKQFTAFAIQLLAAQGKLSLDERQRKRVPD